MLAPPAAAQPASAQTAEPARVEQPRSGIWRAPPGPLQGGRIGLPLAGSVQIGVGRFSVPEPARPRTHTEPVSRAAEIGRRHRGIAAVGLSLRF